MRRRWLAGLLAVACLVVLGACAAGFNPAVDTPGPDGDVAGFWLGLWHGLIVVITFIVSLFNEDVAIYEVHNSGAIYDLGFVLGLFIAFGGPAGGASGRRKR